MEILHNSLFNYLPTWSPVFTSFTSSCRMACDRDESALTPVAPVLLTPPPYSMTWIQSIMCYMKIKLEKSSWKTAFTQIRRIMFKLQHSFYILCQPIRGYLTHLNVLVESAELSFDHVVADWEEAFWWLIRFWLFLVGIIWCSQQLKFDFLNEKYIIINCNLS